MAHSIPISPPATTTTRRRRPIMYLRCRETSSLRQRRRIRRTSTTSGLLLLLATAVVVANASHTGARADRMNPVDGPVGTTTKSASIQISQQRNSESVTAPEMMAPPVEGTTMDVRPEGSPTAEADAGAGAVERDANEEATIGANEAPRRPASSQGSGSVRGSSSVPQRQEQEQQQSRRRIPAVRRIYGPDNGPVRLEVTKLENAMERSRTGFRGDPTHEVPYKNHPFDRRRAERERRRASGADEAGAEDEAMRQKGMKWTDAGADASPGDRPRHLQDDEENAFKPLRIHFDTSALDGERSSSNGAQIDFIKNEILPRTRKYWSEALSVVPVDGNLLISSSELANRKYCGDSEFSEVPSSHISTGVSSADLILYVSGAPSTRFCGPSTLAVAVACNFDQFDRPTAGAINFCLDQVELESDGTASDAVVEDNVDVAVHEAAHVLGMSSNSYRFFWDPDTGEPRTSRPFSSSTVTCVDGVQRSLILPNDNTMKFFLATNGQRYASIVTPKVAAVARNQFDCQTLAGAQLENQPTGAQSCTGDHWDERLFYPEALSGVISPTTNIPSPLTLALMEDSGWYKANYSHANVSPFGLGAGCPFVGEACLVPSDGGDPVVPSYGQGYFCNRASARGCSPAHTHKMACTVIDYSLFYPQRLPDSQFSYFTDPSFGGPRQADYCPVYGSTYSGLKPDELDCRNPDNEDTIDLYSETYGENSMCFESTSGEGRCHVAQCIIDEFILKVNVRGEWLTCSEDFQKIEIKTAGGTISSTITCPRLSSACPDMVCPANCAGRGKCNFQSNVNGTVRPRCECFDETDTSPGCTDSLVLDGKYLEDSSGLLDNLEENFFEPLIAVFVDHPDTWTTASWAWASGLFVIFLLMILCICSSFWPQKKTRKRYPGRY